MGNAQPYLQRQRRRPGDFRQRLLPEHDPVGVASRDASKEPEHFL